MRNLVAFMCSIQLLGLVPHIDAFWPSKGESKCKYDEREPWTYRGRNGPQFWGENYTQCNGRQQSPINLDSEEAIETDEIEELDFVNYGQLVTRATIQNNGHTINVIPTDNVVRSINVEGDTYDLEQLHFHWGDVSTRGSEHTVDRVQYSMEMHLVHRNENNEIAVVGVFFQESYKKNGELQNIINRFPAVMYKNDTTTLQSPFDLSDLLPEDPAFFRYDGSLTTPGCDQGVIWSVMHQVMPVGKTQMKSFRKLSSAPRSQASPSCTLNNNYRPIQPLNGRPVYYTPQNSDK